MNYAVLVERVPHCDHGGGGITAFAAVNSMRSQGHKVTVISLFSGNSPEEDRLHIATLNSLDIEVIMVSNRPPKALKPGFWTKVNPSKSYLFPGFNLRDKVLQIIKSIQPNAIFIYHWNALAAAHGITSFPKFASVGDPANLPRLFRDSFNKAYFRYNPLKRVIKNTWIALTWDRKIGSLQEKMLRECHAYGAFAAHHAEMFRASGNINCLYLHTPIPDPFPITIKKPIVEKFRIMHIGHLQGIATLAGVELLLKAILPDLESLLPQDSFEIHLVGGFFESLPSELRSTINASSYIKVRGQVTPADSEFLAADIVLVPTPIELGIRVRILTAFSFGTCVVAHSANKKGIPEMEHGVNALLGSDGAELARHCKYIFDNPSAKLEIGNRGRKTYEKFFSLEAAGGKLCEIMNSIASSPSP